MVRAVGELLVIRAGDLREPVIIEEPSEAAAAENDYGEIDLTQATGWNRVAERYAQVMTQGSREVERAQQIQPDISHIVRMRYDNITKDVHPKMRLLIRGNPVHIAGIVNVNLGNEFLELTCRERV